jgi:hypothetical protein
MADLVYTFDTLPFQKAMSSIEKGFMSLKKQVKDFDEKSETHGKKIIKKTEKNVKDFSNNSKNMISDLTKRVAQLAAAYLSFKALLKYIPEIGTAFQSAGNIFLRNFLWPLRQYLIPLLQKMLTWVRDNRAMFVKWGTVLVNAFRGVAEIVKGLFGLVKTFMSAFSDTFKRLFGTAAKSISDVINILLFKITVLAQFITAVLKPVFEKIGEWVAVAVKAISSFIRGLATGFGDIAAPFIEIRNLLSDIVRDLTGSNEATLNWAEGFRKAGLIIGGVLKTIIVGVIQAIDTIYMLMQTLTQAIKFISMFFTSASPEDFKKQWKEASGVYERFGERMKNYGKDIINTWGNISENWKEPAKDVIKETKSIIKETGKINKNISSNVNVGDIKVYVSTPEKGEEVGKNVGKGISSSIHGQMKKNINDALLGVATP